LIENYEQKIDLFERLLQKITANITSGVFFEKKPPHDLWTISEEEITSLQTLTNKLKEFMLTLKPERTPTIEARTQALLQPLSNYKDILFRKTDQPLNNSRLALEELRRGIMGGSALLDLSKEIRNNPSEGIIEILKLKEIHDTKEYLSAIPVPKATYVRFKGLRKDIENLRHSVSNLERSIGELRKNLNIVVEDMSDFRPQAETFEETSKEPTLVSDK
jgi:hypothetical protein